MLTFQDTLLTRDEIGTPTMERIRNHLPEESQHLLSGRVQLIMCVPGFMSLAFLCSQTLQEPTDQLDCRIEWPLLT